jgi:predicted transcriptional regulator
MKVLRNERLVKFSKRTDCLCAFSWGTKTATLLGVSNAAVSKVMTAYTNHGKTSSAKRNSVQKRKLSEWDRLTLKRIVSKNHIPTVANVTLQFSVHLEDPCFHKNVLMRASPIEHRW